MRFLPLSRLSVCLSLCPSTCITYLLTPWSRVLLEKLTCFQLDKKFPAFYVARMFITAFTSARHLSLYWASSIQSKLPQPTSWRSILILSSHLRLGLPRVDANILNKQSRTADKGWSSRLGWLSEVLTTRHRKNLLRNIYKSLRTWWLCDHASF